MLSDREIAERVLKQGRIECTHPTRQHIWNAHRECQWYHISQERHDASVTAKAYLDIVADSIRWPIAKDRFGVKAFVVDQVR